MDAEIPLIFANGFPASLESLSERHLQYFLVYLWDYAKVPKSTWFFPSQQAPEQTRVTMLKKAIINVYNRLGVPYLYNLSEGLALANSTEIGMDRVSNDKVIIWNKRTGKKIAKVPASNLSYDLNLEDSEENCGHPFRQRQILEENYVHPYERRKLLDEPMLGLGDCTAKYRAIKEKENGDRTPNTTVSRDSREIQKKENEVIVIDDADEDVVYEISDDEDQMTSAEHVISDEEEQGPSSTNKVSSESANNIVVLIDDSDSEENLKEVNDIPKDQHLSKNRIRLCRPKRRFRRISNTSLITAKLSLPQNDRYPSSHLSQADFLSLFRLCEPNNLPDDPIILPEVKKGDFSKFHRLPLNMIPMLVNHGLVEDDALHPGPPGQESPFVSSEANNDVDRRKSGRFLKTARRKTYLKNARDYKYPTRTYRTRRPAPLLRKKMKAGKEGQNKTKCPSEGLTRCQSSEPSCNSGNNSHYLPEGSFPLKQCSVRVQKLNPVVYRYFMKCLKDSNLI